MDAAQADGRMLRTYRQYGDWDASQVKAACQDTPRNAAIRDAIESLADALQFALRYALPALSERGVYVQYEPCTLGSAGTLLSAAGSALLTLPAAAATTASVGATPPVDDPASSIAADDDDLDLDHMPDADDARSVSVPATECNTSDRGIGRSAWNATDCFRTA